MTTRRMRPVTTEDIESAREEYVRQLERDEADALARSKRFDISIAIVVCVLSVAVAWVTWGHR